MRARRRSICGLDLGGTVPRMAVVVHGRQGPRVQALHTLPPETRLLADGFRQGDLADALGHSELHVAVPGAHTTCRVLSFPADDRHDLEPAVVGALSALLPFGSGDTRVAFEVLRRDGEGTALVVAGATRRATLDALSARLEACDLEPVCIRPAPLAALALIRTLHTDEGILLFLDLAAATPTLAVLADGVPRVVRVLAPETAQAKPPDTARLAEEIRLTLAAGGAAVGVGLLIAGGGRDVSHALGRELGVPVTTLEDLAIPGVPPALRSRQGNFAVALGLALAPLLDRATGSGFPVGSGTVARRRLRAEVARTRALASAAMLLTIVHAGLGYGVARHRVHVLERTLHARLEALPVAAGDTTNVGALRRAVARLRTATPSRTRSPTLEILREVSARVAPGADVVVEAVSLRAGTLTVRGTAADAETVTAVTEGLRVSVVLHGVRVDETRPRDGRVAFVVSADLASGETGAPDAALSDV